MAWPSAFVPHQTFPRFQNLSNDDRVLEASPSAQPALLRLPCPFAFVKVISSTPRTGPGINQGIQREMGTAAQRRLFHLVGKGLTRETWKLWAGRQRGWRSSLFQALSPDSPPFQRYTIPPRSGTPCKQSELGPHPPSTHVTMGFQPFLRQPASQDDDGICGLTMPF